MLENRRDEFCDAFASSEYNLTHSSESTKSTLNAKHAGVHQLTIYHDLCDIYSLILDGEVGDRTHSYW